MSAAHYTIPTSALNSGTYMIQVKSKNGVRVEKMVKQ
ncbi:MAG: T9SS type A sorting domain-containing protein [Bacteroidetes bacterium]|nr:T9SS type A sorting domain-containing protein [Bacteroidota bacterium]